MSYSSVVLGHSPAVYFRTQEASGLLQDSSGNARHATLSGGTSATYQQPSPIASDPSAFSIKFNLFYFRVPDSAGVDLGNTFTLEAWVKRTTFGINSEEFIVCKGVNAYALEIGRLDDEKTLVAKYGVGDIANGDPIADTGWHHIVATKSGTTTKMYHDGVDRTAFVLDYTCADTTDDLWIGADTGTTNQSTSYLAEIAVYPTELTATQVREHYNAANVVATPALYTPIPMRVSS